MKAAGAEWKALSAQQKAVYAELAAEAKTVYLKEKAEYDKHKNFSFRYHIYERN